MSKCSFMLRSHFLHHLLFAHLLNISKELFNFKFLGRNGGPDKLEDFWTDVERRGDPRLLNHPMKRRPRWKRRAIPITVHVDGVPVIAVGKSGTKSLDNLSWGSLLAVGGVLTIKLWITAVSLRLVNDRYACFVCLFV